MKLLESIQSWSKLLLSTCYVPITCTVNGGSHCPHRAFTLFVDKNYKQLNEQNLHKTLQLLWSDQCGEITNGIAQTVLFTEFLEKCSPTNLTLEPIQTTEHIYMARGWRE